MRWKEISFHFHDSEGVQESCKFFPSIKHFSSTPTFILIAFQIVQHHSNDDEMRDERIHQGSVHSTASTTSTMTSINFRGSSTRINCCPLKLLQFLFIDLKTKLKDFVPDGNCCYLRSLPTKLISFLFSSPHSHDADDKEISKVLKEINYAIKQAYLNGVKLWKQNS